MKLKIGNITKKKTVDGKITFGTLSDEELVAMQDKVDGDNIDLGELVKEKEKKKKFVMGLVNNTEKIEELEKEEIEEAKDAVNGINIINDVGINPKCVFDFNEFFPNKKTVYRNLITKQFIEWYINNAKFSWLKKLNIDSEHINPNQKKGIIKMLATRTKRENTPELKDVGTLAEPKLIEVEKEEEFELVTDEEIDMYNLLLTKKWDKKDTMKIHQLNGLIDEQMRTKGSNVHQALKTLIKVFDLKFEKKDVLQRELEEEHSLLEKPKERSNAQITKDMHYSIKYSHYIKFLYKLMSDKMEFTKTPTEEDKKQIRAIKEDFYGHLDQDNPIEEDNNHQSIADMKLDDHLEGFNT